MAHIVGEEVVKYACTCGLLKPISLLYFCRHCLDLRCGYCVCHEVDSHFCGKCAENLPSSEARVKKNRCGNCYDCPSCHQQLSTRAATVGPKNPEDPKATPRKVFYLLCLLCRWSSRDVGIPDQSVVSGGWPERENVHANRLLAILDMYKAVVLLEKQQKEKDKRKQRIGYSSLTSRTGVSASLLRKRVGLPDPYPLLKTKPKELDGAVAKEDVDDLPEDIFTKPVNLAEITTIDQRLVQPDAQPSTVDKLFPVHRQLSVKRSLRCRSCEHNVSKPEYNPNSVKFKIQLFAYYHIPEIRIVTVEPLRAGNECELILKFINPTQHQTSVSFSSLELGDVEEAVELEASEVKSTQDTEEQPSSLVEKQPSSLPLSGSQPSSLLSLSRQPSVTIKPRPITQEYNADTTIPTSSFVLPPRDDAAEYDDSGDTQNIQDDTRLVVRRKSNKAFVRLIVKPREDVKIGSKVITAFTMHHVYTNTISSTVENKEPQKCNHRVKVFLSLGTLVGSE